MLLSRTLRRTTTAISLQQQQQQRRGRTLVTSAQKRALNKTQLEGTKDAPPTTAAASKAIPPSLGGAAAVEGGNSSTSGGGIGKFGLPLLLIGAGGGTVYMANEKNMSPYDYIMSLTGATTKKKEKSAELTNAMKEAVQEITKEEEVPSTPSPAADVADAVVETVANETKEEQEEIVVSLEHPENGNRVDIDKITSFYKTVNEGHAKQQQQQQKAQEELDAAQESATKATQYNESNQTTTTIDPTVALTTATAA
eukprot:scaffold25608_cov85-Skeletonema_marinoi.AAC.1